MVKTRQKLVILMLFNWKNMANKKNVCAKTEVKLLELKLNNF